MNLFSRSVALAFVGTVVWAACGGDSGSSDDPVALCTQGCNKLKSVCFPDGGPSINCEAECSNNDAGGGSSGTCTNQSEITAAYKACLDKNVCEELLSCFDKVPDCIGGGSGGTGGAGGSGGTGGTGGGGDAAAGTCADILACCNRAADNLKAACMMTYDVFKGQGDAACAAALPTIKGAYCP